MAENYTSEYKKKIVRLHLEEGRTYKSITATLSIKSSRISMVQTVSRRMPNTPASQR